MRPGPFSQSVSVRVEAVMFRRGVSGSVKEWWLSQAVSWCYRASSVWAVKEWYGVSLLVTERQGQAVTVRSGMAWLVCSGKGGHGNAGLVRARSG